MTDSVTHRGPDEVGYFHDDLISLGHARLSIIDLHTGSQPMFNENKNFVVVYNGEIYNYQELKSELEKKGHNFSTSSDTEVIVHAYEEYGIESFNMFNGSNRVRVDSPLSLAISSTGISLLSPNQI